MSAPSASNGAMTLSAHAEPDTRLHGRWLLLARVAWVGVVALIVGVFITSLPVFLVQLQVTCAPATCSFWQLTSAAAQTLQSLGFSPGAYAIYTLTLVIVFGLVWLVSALVIFWRKSDDWMALLFALMFVLLGSLFFSNSLVHLGRYPVLFNLLFFVFLACIVGAQVYRYRRVSTAVQRQQTKWVVFATAMTILVGLGLIGPALLFPSLSPPYILLAETVSTIFALIIPISVGMAILRYRLWEIDTIINKALVYGTLTVMLALIYAGLVIGLQTLLRLFLGQVSQSSVVIIGSTLAIAGLF